MPQQATTRGPYIALSLQSARRSLNLHENLIQPFRESSRIFQLPSFNKTGLTEDDLYKIFETLFVLFIVEFLDQTMFGIDSKLGLDSGTDWPDTSMIFLICAPISSLPLRHAADSVRR